MSSIAVVPSSIESIKRLATSIKRDQKLTHSRALDAAAVRAGFSNFRHARNALTSAPASSTRQPPAQPLYPLWITAYWRDQAGRCGRETLRMLVRRPWGSILRPSQMTRIHGMGYFRSDASDAFESRTDLTDQRSAREEVCRAARSLQFMEITGLLPLTGQLSRLSEKVQGMPRRDHVSYWHDPATETMVVVDEPYLDGFGIPEREDWARSNGAAIASSRWSGMHSPGSSAAFLLTSIDGRADILATLVQQLDAAAEPVRKDLWPGETASYLPLFVSPERARDGRAKRARRKPLYAGQIRNKAIVYGRTFFGGAWRPNARMPLTAHREAGNLLKELLQHGRLRGSAYGRLGHVRSELDEWVQREYTDSRDLPHEDLNKLYYQGSASSGLDPSDAIARVDELLRQHYPDCVPRRDLVRSLAAAKKDLLREPRQR